MKVRDSRFELVRIVAIIFIILGHILSQSGDVASDLMLNRFFVNYLGNLGRISVNLFLFIGIWFMIDKEFNSIRIVKLWAEVFIYSITIEVVIFVLCPHFNNLQNVILCLFPVFGKRLWFASIYIILLIFAPLLNEICKLLTANKLKLFCILQFIFISVYSTLSPFQDTTLCNITWFFFIYFVVYYLKKNCEYKKFNSKKLILSAFVMYFLLASGVMFLNEMNSYISNYKILKITHRLLAQCLFDFKSVPAFIISIFLFLAVLNFKSFKNKVINYISASTFAVYIFHQVPGWYDILWNKIFKVNSLINSEFYILYTLTIVVVLFIIVMILEIIRKRCIESIFINSMPVKKICGFLDKRYYKLFN